MRHKPGSIIGVVIPAHNERDRIALTLRAVYRLPGLRRVVVIDDGSEDDTALFAGRMGATVVRSRERSGKGAAVRRGLRLVNDCPYVLLLDADLGDTASEAWRLLRPVICGEADVAVARFDRHLSGSGLGIVKTIAKTAVRVLRHAEIDSVLSGQRLLSQRAIRALRSLDDGYGLEVGMTLDLLQQGVRISEIDVPMANRDHGRGLRGFYHRGRQLLHILRSVSIRVCFQ